MSLMALGSLHTPQLYEKTSYILAMTLQNGIISFAFGAQTRLLYQLRAPVSRQLCSGIFDGLPTSLSKFRRVNGAEIDIGIAC
jgi:hypothetical protein